MKLTKKEFYERIVGKKAIIENLQEIKELAKMEVKNSLLMWYKQGFYTQYKNRGIKFFYKVENERVYLYGYKKDKDNKIVLDSNPLMYTHRIKEHERDFKTRVTSQYVIINGCAFEKKDIELLSEWTFKTPFSPCIYRIID